MDEQKKENVAYMEYHSALKNGGNVGIYIK
jgi:hypothetical protein